MTIIRADARLQFGRDERVVGVRIDDQFDHRPVAGLAGGVSGWLARTDLWGVYKSEPIN
jgi:SH3-like domain-containing protein